MDGPSLSIQQELAALAKRVEKLEHGLEFVKQQELEALKASPMMTQHAPRVRGFTGEPTKLLQHLECVVEALKDIDWPAHSEAVASAVELLRQPAHSAATTAPLPRLDRDAVAAGWRKIRDEREPAPQAQQGVTVEELVDCLPSQWNGNHDEFARYLLAHDRLGPLLRGEDAPVRVVLPEEPPAPEWLPKDFRYLQGRRDAWNLARAEAARQQGRQADD